MACTRRVKTLVSTCVILSGMTNIVCLLYAGWITRFASNGSAKVPERKLEDDPGETLRILERLDRLENVVKQHIQGTDARAHGDRLESLCCWGEFGGSCGSVSLFAVQTLKCTYYSGSCGKQ